MKKNTLARTNIIICLIILIGFVVTSVISYRSNVSIYENDAQQVSTLATDSIYNELTSVFAQPVNVSLTMANDTLLKDFLSAEERKLTDETYLAEMQKYLSAYRGKYSYDSVFLVSCATNRYYHYN
ncbi:MAG: GGDEF domain-containing protein, partial [Christensenella sp.]